MINLVDMSSAALQALAYAPVTRQQNFAERSDCIESHVICANPNSECSFQIKRWKSQRLQSLETNYTENWLLGVYTSQISGRPTYRVSHRGYTSDYYFRQAGYVMPRMYVCLSVCLLATLSKNFAKILPQM